MTARKHPLELRRPRRTLGSVLRAHLLCPLCGGDVAVIAYRQRTTRLECEACKLRVSVNPADVARVMADQPEAILANASDQRMHMLVFAFGAIEQGGTAEDVQRRVLDGIRNNGRCYRAADPPPAEPCPRVPSRVPNCRERSATQRYGHLAIERNPLGGTAFAFL